VRACEERRQGRAQLGEHYRAERQLEVAHAIEVDDRTPTIGIALLSCRSAARQLLEQAVERGQRAEEIVTTGIGDRVARSLEAVERGERVGPLRRVGLAREANPQIALGIRAHRQDGVDTGCPRKRLDGPHLEVDDPFADEIARADSCRRTALVEAAPGKRSEEPDRVVLRAITLPVARNNLLLAEPPGRARTLLAGELVDG
jgi:hypothetical protein